MQSCPQFPLGIPIEQVGDTAQPPPRHLPIQSQGQLQRSAYFGFSINCTTHVNKNSNSAAAAAAAAAAAVTVSVRTVARPRVLQATKALRESSGIALSVFRPRP
jgi:hypothetical protein